MWAIQDDVIRWIKEIEEAARARKESGNRLAPVSDAMPRDIRLVADAFNDMVIEGDKRENVLRSALEANQYLIRELNHRVKNSLQVIQSYLALSRRQHKRANDPQLIEIEAKVQVMSTAYRLALLEGSMRPVQLKEFAEEIIDTLSGFLREPHQWIYKNITAEVGLVVDRTIPIGLALVEAVSSGLKAPNAREIHVILEVISSGAIIFIIKTDGDIEKCRPSRRIMDGLAAQIGATAHKVVDGEVLHWDFVA
jgi:two-component system, sensor histidine kinase PdtaS